MARAISTRPRVVEVLQLGLQSFVGGLSQLRGIAGHGPRLPAVFEPSDWPRGRGPAPKSAA